MKFSPSNRRSTCRNVPVKYSRGFMAAFQSIIGVYPWKIKRHPSWPRTSAYQSIDARAVSFFLFFISSILMHTLVSSFYFRRRGISLWFPGCSALLFDLPIFSFFYIFFPFQTALGEVLYSFGMERVR